MDEMVFYYPQGHAAHFETGHPERPERVETLCESLQAAGWWHLYPHLEPFPLPEALLLAVHDPAYLAILRAACQRGQHLDMDTYTTPASWQLALNAAGGAIALATAVWSGAARRGFALTRPPGHHATRHYGMGFCLLNNIALAAQFLLSRSLENPSPAGRLAIIDLDLHHGNGTQDIFWERQDVFYLSTHQYPFYPGSGSLEEQGAGAGAGCTANFPLPPLTGDLGFETFMQEVILPLLDRYAPQMLLVSFGFDPHWLDPLGRLSLSAGGFGALVSALTGWADQNCDGKIALFLEGGYHLDAGRACAQAVTAALLRQPWRDPIGPSPGPENNSWKSILQAAKKIWGL